MIRNSLNEKLKNKILALDNSIVVENLNDNHRSEPRGRYDNYALFVVRPKNVKQVSKVLPKSMGKKA